MLYSTNLSKLIRTLADDVQQISLEFKHISCFVWGGVFFPSFQELKIIHKLNFLGSYCFSKTCCEFPFFHGISSSRNTFKCITYG